MLQLYSNADYVKKVKKNTKFRHQFKVTINTNLIMQRYCDAKMHLFKILLKKVFFAFLPNSLKTAYNNTTDIFKVTLCVLPIQICIELEK